MELFIFLRAIARWFSKVLTETFRIYAAYV
jgi:hypothetical protein